MDEKRLQMMEDAANGEPLCIDDWRDDVRDLVAEVRRLQALLQREQARPDAIVTAYNPQEARREERKRCAEFLRQQGAEGGGDSVMSDRWAAWVADEMLALPD